MEQKKYYLFSVLQCYCASLLRHRLRQFGVAFHPLNNGRIMEMELYNDSKSCSLSHRG